MNLNVLEDSISHVAASERLPGLEKARLWLRIWAVGLGLCISPSDSAGRDGCLLLAVYPVRPDLPPSLRPLALACPAGPLDESERVPSLPLTRCCCSVASRPKHLLVFINPLGGKGQGKRVYEKKVAPLFTLASITTDIIGKA